MVKLQNELKKLLFTNKILDEIPSLKEIISSSIEYHEHIPPSKVLYNFQNDEDNYFKQLNQYYNLNQEKYGSLIEKRNEFVGIEDYLGITYFKSDSNNSFQIIDYLNLDKFNSLQIGIGKIKINDDKTNSFTIKPLHAGFLPHDKKIYQSLSKTEFNVDLATDLVNATNSFLEQYFYVKNNHKIY